MGRAQAWAGHPPEARDEARERLLSAAVACLGTLGPDRISMNDVAREAGVTRRTVYAYFSSREALLSETLLFAGLGLADQLVALAAQFDEPADKLTELLVRSVRALRSQPALRLLLPLDSPVKGEAHSITDATYETTRPIVELALGDDTSLELVEVCLRWLLSLARLDGPAPRDDDELRAFIRRYVLPSVGL